MCVLILRSISTKLINLEKSKNRMFYLKSRDAKMTRRTTRGVFNTSDRYFDQEHFEINQKSLRRPVKMLRLKQ